MTCNIAFPFRPNRARVAALCIAWFVSVSAQANPANCDDDMTEDQRFQAELCSAHVGCRFVMGIAETCVQIKKFLSKLGLIGKDNNSKVTDDHVRNSLTELGMPQTGIASCLSNLDWTKCKEHFSGGPKPPSAKDQADEIVERLKAKVFSTTVWDAGWGLAKVGLRMCENATNEANVLDAVRAKERCALAENNVRECLATRETHDALRKNLQNLIDSGGLGADAASYRNMANSPYPECPTTLPTTGKTPQVALADYLKLWDTPVEAKSKQADTANSGNTAVLSRNGTNGGADELRNALNKTSQEEKDGLARERARTQAAENSAAATQPKPLAAKASSVSDKRTGSSSVDPDAWTKRVCDTQCAMIVSEYKCKHIRSIEENLSCQMQNGIMHVDNPEICAEAKAVSGCVTKAESLASKQLYDLQQSRPDHSAKSGNELHPSQSGDNGTLNGRLRTADKPLLTVGVGVNDTSFEQSSAFSREWDIREEILYGLGEKMLEWGNFNLQTAAGREAFLRACDERIAAARAKAAKKQ